MVWLLSSLGRQREEGGSAQSLSPGAGITVPAHKGTWLRLQSPSGAEGSSCQNLCSRGCGQSQPSGYTIVEQFSFIIFGWPQSPVKELFPSALMGAGFSLVLEVGMQGRRWGSQPPPPAVVTSRRCCPASAQPVRDCPPMPRPFGTWSLHQPVPPLPAHCKHSPCRRQKSAVLLQRGFRAAEKAGEPAEGRGRRGLQSSRLTRAAVTTKDEELSPILVKKIRQKILKAK